MEFFHIDNAKYIVKCPECSEIIGFRINFEKFLISVECKNGHNKENIPYDDFKSKYIKPSQVYWCNCNKCFKLLNNESINYECKSCNKLFCPNCINNHKKETNHRSIIKFYQDYQLCQKHNQKYSSFCEICKISLCDKCKKSHKNHSTKPILDIIPNKVKENSIKKNYEEFNKKIDEVISIIQDYRDEIDKRYYKINGFLSFIRNINRNLLINFNCNCYDYYNFDNFNYLYNSLKNEEIFDTNKYKNYLLDIDNNEIKVEIEEKKEEKPIKDINKNERDNSYITQLNKLEYLKDNIFYVFDKTLNIYAFENYSFKSILSYDLSKFRIRSLQPAKYSNKILINFALKKNIKILEYDIINKSIYLSKKEIKEQKFGYPNHFYKCLDNKNGNILTQDNDGIIVWKTAKKNYFIKETTIVKDILSLYDISESLICFQEFNWNITFFNSENYIKKKSISYNEEVNLIGIINNESIVFSNNKSNAIFIVDVKYLEIVHVFECNKYYSYMKLKNNKLLLININKEKEKENENNLLIHKSTFDPKEKIFNNKEIIKKTIDMSYISNILITDNGYLVITCYTNVVLLNV